MNNDLIKPEDAYTELYAHEKRLHPSKKIVLRSFKKSHVEGIDWLERQIGFKRDKVETSDDWLALSKILEFWTRLWPNEWAEYVKSMQEIRGTRARADGYSKEHGRKGVRYLGALPPRLMKLIKVYFPYQQWDREFVEKFTSNIKISKVGEKVDTWFSLPDAPLIRKDLVKEAADKVILELKGKKNGNTRQITKGS